MTTIVEFLQARIAEDEAVAQAFRDGSSWGNPYAGDGDGSDIAYSNRFDESRVLAECIAKRQIIAAWELTHHNINLAMLYIIASVYSDHPDFNPAWGSVRQDT